MKGRSVAELKALGQSSLKWILTCSLIRMNLPIFRTALKCIEAYGSVSDVLARVLRHHKVRGAIMKADDVELLKQVTERVAPKELACHADDLLLYAIKFRARRCEKYLKGFAEGWAEIPGMLEA